MQQEPKSIPHCGFLDTTAGTVGPAAMRHLPARIGFAAYPEDDLCSEKSIAVAPAEAARLVA